MLDTHTHTQRYTEREREREREIALSITEKGLHCLPKEALKSFQRVLSTSGLKVEWNRLCNIFIISENKYQPYIYIFLF